MTTPARKKKMKTQGAAVRQPLFACALAVADQAKEIGLDVVGGAFSGGVLSGARTGGSTVADHISGNADENTVSLTENKPAGVENSENGGIIKAVPLSRYLNSSDDIYRYAKNVIPEDGYEDIFIHGDDMGFEVRGLNGEAIDSYSALEFARILLKDPNYKGSPIRLIACEAGARQGIAAQTLANVLGVDVLAPTDLIWVFPDGKLVIGPSEYENTGTWETFHPRR